MNEIVFAFGLTLFAGLATGIGSLLAFFSKKTSPRFLAGALGFSAGVMIYVSFIEIFVKANDSLGEVLGYAAGYRLTTLAFFGGMAVIALIDTLVPEYENPHEIRTVGQLNGCGEFSSEGGVIANQIRRTTMVILNVWDFFQLLPLQSITFRRALQLLPELYRIQLWV